MPRLSPAASKKERRERMAHEMRKFHEGHLYSSSGEKVTSAAQAKAIGMSEAGMSKRRGKRRMKKHMGM